MYKGITQCTNDKGTGEESGSAVSSELSTGLGGEWIVKVEESGAAFKVPSLGDRRAEGQWLILEMVERGLEPEAGDGSEFHFEQVSCKEMVEHPDKHN